MYADNTLTPKEAVRLCALGTLASGPVRYSALATSIRHFISHITGPSLEVMGTSLELLKYEGLVTAVDGGGMEDDALLGIPDEFHENLFDRLTQVDTSDTRQVGGTGLGLNISRTIIEKHGGNIGFESNQEQGTVFYFDLPLLD